ncbi:hypothetical protein [Microvirga lotononidis]|uniref:Uncharacterized protein n=1 Tax=Microvirga lotononidis TaxID=864069 RepID=I4Z231_9HYPH|nr:hypothetical protein [Microvirga lotononidis]EIM30273.1 hypothetical protein MicloDRAFT_00010780 [Microvirga lotononidis]WQO31115.1 hypothetical protein U0023_32935 [Microvirga lotononidis]
MPECLTPFDAAATFRRLEAMDRATGSSETARFARAYEDEAPEGDFSVYLERLEAERAAFCETASSP